MEGSVSQDVQDTANQLVDSAQTLANGAVDLGEDAAKLVFGAALTAIELIATTIRAIESKLVG